MAESSADDEADAVRSWYKSLLDKVVKEMVRVEVVTGAAVQASPVWMVPYEILIAKVWGYSHESQFVWTASVDKLIADHIAGHLAATPRDVARHFAMKWQMDADRLLNLEKNTAAVEIAGMNMQAYAKQLIQHAESLYDLAERDDVWQEPQTFDDGPSTTDD